MNDLSLTKLAITEENMWLDVPTIPSEYQTTYAWVHQYGQKRTGWLSRRLKLVPVPSATWKGDSYSIYNPTRRTPLNASETSTFTTITVIPGFKHNDVWELATAYFPAMGMEPD